MSCSDIQSGTCENFSRLRTSHCIGLCDTSNFQPRYAPRPNIFLPSIILNKQFSVVMYGCAFGCASLLTLAVPEVTEPSMRTLHETSFRQCQSLFQTHQFCRAHDICRSPPCEYSRRVQGENDTTEQCAFTSPDLHPATRIVVQSDKEIIYFLASGHLSPAPFVLLNFTSLC
jgi:hypothetical protein